MASLRDGFKLAASVATIPSDGKCPHLASFLKLFDRIDGVACPAVDSALQSNVYGKLLDFFSRQLPSKLLAWTEEVKPPQPLPWGLVASAENFALGEVCPPQFATPLSNLLPAIVKLCPSEDDGTFTSGDITVGAVLALSAATIHELILSVGMCCGPNEEGHSRQMRGSENVRLHTELGKCGALFDGDTAERFPFVHLMVVESKSSLATMLRTAAGALIEETNIELESYGEIANGKVLSSPIAKVYEVPTGSTCPAEVIKEIATWADVVDGKTFADLMSRGLEVKEELDELAALLECPSASKPASPKFDKAYTDLKILTACSLLHMPPAGQTRVEVAAMCLEEFGESVPACVQAALKGIQ